MKYYNIQNRSQKNAHSCVPLNSNVLSQGKYSKAKCRRLNKLTCKGGPEPQAPLPTHCLCVYGIIINKGGGDLNQRQG
jgi:hypothetical protein